MRPNDAAVAASLLLLAAACGGGRSASPDLVPAPLVASLIESAGGMAGESREIVVGTLPPGFPEALVPPGRVEIVGGMVAGREIDVIFADSTRRLAAVAEEQFERAGFTRPQERRGSGFSRPSGQYQFFCREDAVVSATPLAGAQRHHVRVRYSRVPGGRSWCELFAPPPAADRLVIPALTPPANAHVHNAGGGGGSSEVNSHASISGSGLVPATILAHYAEQLVAAGWTSSEPAVSRRVAAQHLEARGADGAAWEGVLVAVGSETSVELSLTMKPRSGP